MPPFSAIYPARFFYCACISHLCWLCGPVPLRARNHLYPRPKRQNRKTCPQNNKPWPRTANSKATNHLSHNDSAAEKRWDKTGPTEHKKRQTKRVAAKNPPQRTKITKNKGYKKNDRESRNIARVKQNAWLLSTSKTFCASSWEVEKWQFLGKTLFSAN